MATVSPNTMTTVKVTGARLKGQRSRSRGEGAGLGGDDDGEAGAGGGGGRGLRFLSGR